MSLSSSVVSKPFEPEMNVAFQKPGNSFGHGLIEGGGLENAKGVIGVLNVYIHRARDIQNICIYHKQDVYAKICLTDDPEKTASTQTVNGGGRDPVFNESLQLDVRSIDSSLKCEVWMLSRIKNYLQDQLLGFALVPLTDIIIENGKLAKEFSLTSDDMFHSPTGSVQLTLAYNGASPEVLVIPSTHSSLMVSSDEQRNEGVSSVPREFEMIEFLDPKIVTENEMMVTEYYANPCVNLDSGDPKSIDNIVPDKNIHSEVDAPAPAVVAESDEKDQKSIDVSNKIIHSKVDAKIIHSKVDAPTPVVIVGSEEVTEVSKVQTLQSSVSINGSPSGPVVTSSSSPLVSVVRTSSPFASDTQVNEEKIDDVRKASTFVKPDVISPDEKTEDVAKALDFANDDVVSPNEKTQDAGEAHVTRPLVSVNIEPEPEVVQQDYADMYMKSMQQFTEALAKMKLPFEKIGTELAAPKEKDSAKKEHTTSKDSGPSPRVFYGSRAFF